ncbi:hypothetical protein LSO9J_70035 [Candidatus Liberibacter solanacearum]
MFCNCADYFFHVSHNPIFYNIFFYAEFYRKNSSKSVLFKCATNSNK